MSDWLIALISPEQALREHAALMIFSMNVGVMDPRADITSEMLPVDQEAHKAAFGVAVRSAVDSPGFPRRAYVEALMRFIEESAARWTAQYRKDHERFNRVASKIESRMAIDASVEQLERETRRLMQALCASVSNKTAPEMEQAQIWANCVFNQLDRALLEAPEQLANWFKVDSRWLSLREAFKRIGPAGIAFAPHLLAKMDALAHRKEAYWWDGTRTLAAICREDSTTIRALIERLKAAPAVAGNAIHTLGEIGQPVLEVSPTIVDHLLALSRHQSEFVRLAALSALGELGSARPDASERLVEAIRHGKDCEPGYAIDAIRPEVLAAEIAVPMLIQLFDTFEEFDPDRAEQGEHARLAEALTRYGSSAVAAVPVLIANLGNADELNKAVVRCLGAIGPDAYKAAASLAKAAKRVGIGNLATDESYVGQAWRKISPSQ